MRNISNLPQTGSWRERKPLSSRLYTPELWLWNAVLGGHGVGHSLNATDSYEDLVDFLE